MNKKYIVVLLLCGFQFPLSSNAKDLSDAKYPIKCLATGKISLKIPNTANIAVFDVGAVSEIQTPSGRSVAVDVATAEGIAFKTCNVNLGGKQAEYQRANQIEFRCPQSFHCHTPGVRTVPAIPVDRKDEVDLRGVPGPLMDDQCLNRAQSVGSMICTDAEGDFLINHRYTE